MPTISNTPLKILIIVSDIDDFHLLESKFSAIDHHNFHLEWTNQYALALNKIRDGSHDVYLIDQYLGIKTGHQLLKEAQADQCRSPLILLTEHEDKQIDEAALQAGAADYLVKTNLDPKLLERSIRYSLQQARHIEALKLERANLNRRIKDHTYELSQANEELATASKAKDEFLANMSHELRTPLTGILAMTEVLAQETYGPLNEKQKRYMLTVEESSQHLLSLVNDILDLAKIEAGKIELLYSEVALQPLCDSSIRLVRQSSLKKNIQISLDIESNLTTIQCDERRLKQILVNLLSNAVKFTPENGSVGLSVRKDKEFVQFTVWDKGIGIARNRLQHLFKPFMQLDSSLSRRFQGTGLGLALVERMAKLHNGQVSVHSEEGAGSQFHITLPRRQEGAVPLANAATRTESTIAPFSTEQSEPRPLILLAEDNAINVQVYRDFLLSKGFQVKVAYDGLEALEAITKQRPSLVLMDIQMPRMDGLQAIKRLRSDANYQNLPIIALTALTMPGDRERCLLAGADNYLGKPVKLSILLQTIHTLLNQKSQSSQANGV